MTSSRLAPGQVTPDADTDLGVNLDDDVPCDIQQILGITVQVGLSFYFQEEDHLSVCGKPSKARVHTRCPQCAADAYRFMCLIHMSAAYREELVCKVCSYVGIQVVGKI